MNNSMPVVKDLVVPLELFPHLGSEETVHSAVAQLFSHTANGTGKLMFDELLVINSQSQYVGRLTIQGSYFTGSRNLAVTMRHRPLAAAARRIFETSWTAPGAKPLDPDAKYEPKIRGEEPPPGKKKYGG